MWEPRIAWSARTAAWAAAFPALPAVSLRHSGKGRCRYPSPTLQRLSRLPGPVDTLPGST
jgi:hypothetical protein